jgi:hypothetical protein
MSTVSWTGGDGNWTSGADWSTGSAPRPSDDVALGGTGGYAVSMTTPVVVNSILISDSSATLVIDATGVTEVVSAGLVNSGQVDIEGQSGGTQVSIGGTLTNAGTLTIGDGNIVTVAGLTTDAGTINLESMASLVVSGGLTMTGSDTNGGRLDVDTNGFALAGGSTLTVLGMLTVSSGGAVTIGNATISAPTVVSAAALSQIPGGFIGINGGSGKDQEQATLSIGSRAPTVWDSYASLTGNAVLEFTSGSISSIAAAPNFTVSLQITGPDAFIEDADRPGSNSALTGLQSIGSTLELVDTALVTSVGLTLTSTGSLVIDQGATGTHVTIGGTLTNSGMVFAGDRRGAASAGVTVISAADLDNIGTVDLGNAPGGAVAPVTLDLTASAPTVFGGSADLLGYASIVYGGGSVESIGDGGTLTLDGPNAFIADAVQPGSDSALAGLASNAGTFELEDGASIALNPSFEFFNSGTIALDDQTSFTHSGGSHLGFGALISNDGEIVVDGDPLVNSAGSLLNISAGLVGSGSIELGGVGTVVDFAGTVANGQLIQFTDATGTVAMDDPFEFSGTIAGLVVANGAPTDEIDLTHITSGSIEIANLNTTTGVLSVTAAGDPPISIRLSGIYAPGTFVDWVADGTGSGSDIFLSTVACFCRGTLILTSAGEVPVEELAIGDRVINASRAIRPIKWIGRRSYTPRFAWRQKHLLPVCIKADALADEIPRRDLWISPNHALYLEGALIEVGDLINGVSIVQPAAVEEPIEYFHVELHDHDLIIAERTIVESYIDDDNRNLFHNADEYRTLYPGTGNLPTKYCVPRLAEGSSVQNARNFIANRARQVFVNQAVNNTSS